MFSDIERYAHHYLHRVYHQETGHVVQWLGYYDGMGHVLPIPHTFTQDKSQHYDRSYVMIFDSFPPDFIRSFSMLRYMKEAWSTVWKKKATNIFVAGGKYQVNPA